MRTTLTRIYSNLLLCLTLLLLTPGILTTGSIKHNTRTYNVRMVEKIESEAQADGEKAVVSTIYSPG